jgi:hypothetical protein
MKAIISIAKSIDAVLKIGALLAVAVIVAKMLGVKEIEMPKIENVKVPVEHAWIAFAALTVAHAYWTVLFVRKSAALYNTERQTAKRTWELLTENGPLFFRGMIPTTFTGTGIVVRSIRDLPFLVAHAAALTTFAALVPWVAFGQMTWLSIAPAVVLTISNWLIGGYWVISALELNNDDSKFLQSMPI